MKHVFSTAFFLLGFSFGIQAQSEISFTTLITFDTIQGKQRFEITYLLENASGSDFKVGDLQADFRIIGGPNTASSFLRINGETTQEQSWSYFLLPKSEGPLTIPSATVLAKGQQYESAPLIIWIDENQPNGFKIGPEAPIPAEKPKTKRKTSRI